MNSALKREHSHILDEENREEISIKFVTDGPCPIFISTAPPANDIFFEYTVTTEFVLTSSRKKLEIKLCEIYVKTCYRLKLAIYSMFNNEQLITPYEKEKRNPTVANLDC